MPCFVGLRAGVTSLSRSQSGRNFRNFGVHVVPALQDGHTSFDVAYMFQVRVGRARHAADVAARREADSKNCKHLPQLVLVHTELSCGSSECVCCVPALSGRANVAAGHPCWRSKRRCRRRPPPHDDNDVGCMTGWSRRLDHTSNRRREHLNPTVGLKLLQQGLWVAFALHLL